MILGQRLTPLSHINIQLRGRYVVTMLQKYILSGEGEKNITLLFNRLKYFKLFMSFTSAKGRNQGNLV